MQLNLEKIEFTYSDADKGLFDPYQIDQMRRIEKHYIDLFQKVKSHFFIPIRTTHKQWIIPRVQRHANSSIMRLLYLSEVFCHGALSYNTVAVAANVKSMLEIPLHMGYLVWIISEHDDFDSIRNELDKLGYGNRDPKTGLTHSAKVSGRDLAEKTDLMVEKHFDQTGGLFHALYKEANATGHHNFEGRDMLCGLESKGNWNARDRKEQFLFYTSTVFQFFFHCEAVLGITLTLFDMMEHYLGQLPENFPSKK